MNAMKSEEPTNYSQRCLSRDNDQRRLTFIAPGLQFTVLFESEIGFNLFSSSIRRGSQVANDKRANKQRSKKEKQILFFIMLWICLAVYFLVYLWTFYKHFFSQRFLIQNNFFLCFFNKYFPKDENCSHSVL